MKLLYSLIILIVCLCHFNATSSVIENGDSTKKIKFVIKTDLLFPILGAISKEKIVVFTLEMQFKKRHSIQLTYLGGFYYADDITSYGAEYISKRNALILYPEYKFFVSKKKSHNGYYIGVFGAYTYSHETYNSSEMFYRPGYTRQTETVYQTVGGGIMNGYQFYFKKHLTFDFIVGGGLGELIHVQNIKGYTYGNNYSPIFIPRVGATIGYKF